jgi:hypothetical protein
VGTSAASRVRWLLTCAGLSSFETLPPHTQRRLRWEMQAFFEPRGMQGGLRIEEDETSRWLRRIQKGLKRLSAGKKAWLYRVNTHYSFWVPLNDDQIEYATKKAAYRGVTGSQVMDVRKRAQPNELFHKRTVQDEWKETLCRVLESAASRLRRCVRPKCSELFVRRGRRRYCSTKCGWVLRQRKKRERLKWSEGKASGGQE